MQCPKCHSIFQTDDVFCPNDGSTLVNVSGGSASQFVSGGNPTEVLPRPDPIPPAVQTQRTNFLYLVIGALGAIAIGALAILFWSLGSKSDDKFVTVNPSNDQKTSSSPPGNTAPATPAINTNSGSQAVVAPITGSWSGDWSSPSGAYLTVVFSLNDDGTGHLDGQIDWTLRRTRRPDKIGKIGMSAVEYVRGKFDPASRRITLQGYRKDDPNNVLVMVDSYRLILSGDGSRLNGTARNGGNWNARINLAR